MNKHKEMRKTMIEATKKQIKHLMLTKQGLIGDNLYQSKSDIVELFKRAGCIQFDPIDICGRNADIVLFSRVKNYEKSYLDTLLYEDRLLVDQWDKVMSIYATSDWESMTPMRKRNQEVYEQNLKEYQWLIADVLKQLETLPYLNADDLEIDIASHFFTWRHKTMGKAILDYLFFKGDVIIHHREGVKKYYALTSKYLTHLNQSQHDVIIDQNTYHKFMIKRRIGAVGVLGSGPSDAYLGVNLKTAERKKYIEEMVLLGELTEIKVEGIKDCLYILSEDLGLLQEGDVSERVEFIAPLDQLIWDRKLIKKIFDFEYKWEIYHKPELRKIAPYALPILYDHDFIGQIEMTIDRKAKQWIVKNIWYKHKAPKQKVKKLIDKKIQAFSKLNGCTSIVYVDDYEKTYEEI
ncbi:MAG: crosslink repair DNA glycosylase YcaQ family protein [Acholeplasmataceae bacterium]